MGRDVIEYMQKLDMKDITAQMALQCAPLFTGLKVSNLLIIPAKKGDPVREALEGTEICVRKLTEFKGRITYILFQRGALEAWISREDNRQFLAENGYEGCSLDSILNKIEGRYCAYVRENKSFPHEIGILLGYPVQDVKGFVVNDGRNYLCSGYWKVYGNLSEARKTFRKYELAKETLLRRILEGISIRNIIASCG